MFRVAQRRQQIEQRFGSLVHSQSVRLDNQHIGEPVHHQARQPVPLRVDHSIGVRHGLQLQSFSPQPDRPLQPMLPPAFLGHRLVGGQEAGGDLRMGIEQPPAKSLAGRLRQPDQIAGVGFAGELPQPFAKQKRMRDRCADFQIVNCFGFHNRQRPLGQQFIERTLGNGIGRRLSRRHFSRRFHPRMISGMRDELQGTERSARPPATAGLVNSRPILHPEGA